MDKKAIVFVDANNWYHNLKGWFTPSEIDISKVVNFIAKEKKLEVLEIRWYASVLSIEDNKLDYMKHMNFLSILQGKGIRVITRKLQRLSNKEILKKRQELLESWDLCDVCKPIVNESFLDISDHSKKEKGIDVGGCNYNLLKKKKEHKKKSSFFYLKKKKKKKKKTTKKKKKKKLFFFFFFFFLKKKIPPPKTTPLF